MTPWGRARRPFANECAHTGIGADHGGICEADSSQRASLELGAE
ncbi:hypothetical protein ppKF707_1736 [Metapseudomonas furukawaii]|uniref:Uncharacterized protein n=1 Tax=Metapseudomonas furukawaii TaxID=1149133 RepID=A0AAD1FFU2_METFU|nr:hypothetical protein ppKF707_1736 [Pseudomonas furukawaii]BAU75235.1 hypothetical protein KF707C_35470 [Pseudomonas furukawaii]